MKTSIKCVLFLTLIMSFVELPAMAKPKVNDRMKRILTNVDNVRFGSFTFYGLPIQGDGVGSLARDNHGKYWSGRVVCQNYQCLGLSQPQTDQDFINVDSRYITNVESSEFQISDDTTNKSFVDASLGNLLKYVNISFTNDISRNANIQFDSGGITIRRLNPAYGDYILGLKRNVNSTFDKIIKGRENGELTVITEDIVVTDLTFSVVVKDDGKGQNLKLELQNVATTNPKFEVTHSNPGTNTFKVKFKKPYVIAVKSEFFNEWNT